MSSTISAMWSLLAHSLSCGKVLGPRQLKEAGLFLRRYTYYDCTSTYCADSTYHAHYTHYILSTYYTRFPSAGGSCSVCSASSSARPSRTPSHALRAARSTTCLRPPFPPTSRPSSPSCYQTPPVVASRPSPPSSRPWLAPSSRDSHRRHAPPKSAAATPPLLPRYHTPLPPCLLAPYHLLITPLTPHPLLLTTTSTPAGVQLLPRMPRRLGGPREMSRAGGRAACRDVPQLALYGRRPLLLHLQLHLLHLLYKQCRSSRGNLAGGPSACDPRYPNYEQLTTLKGAAVRAHAALSHVLMATTAHAAQLEAPEAAAGAAVGEAAGAAVRPRR